MESCKRVRTYVYMYVYKRGYVGVVQEYLGFKDWGLGRQIRDCLWGCLALPSISRKPSNTCSFASPGCGFKCLGLSTRV